MIDLCKPTAQRYETAIMTVLARNLDAIVVETEGLAIDCIEASSFVKLPDCL